MSFICHCTHIDGRVYPSPVRPCPNNHLRGDEVSPDVITLDEVWDPITGPVLDPLYGGLFAEPGNLVATAEFKNLAPETMALMMGLHPATFDPQGRALVQAILDKKAAQ